MNNYNTCHQYLKIECNTSIYTQYISPFLPIEHNLGITLQHLTQNMTVTKSPTVTGLDHFIFSSSYSYRWRARFIVFNQPPDGDRPEIL